MIGQPEKKCTDEIKKMNFQCITFSVEKAKWKERRLEQLLSFIVLSE